MAKSKGKKNIFKSLTDFIKGVKCEARKIIWPSKKNLVKYSVVTLAFMIFICLFFIGADLIIALVSYVKELIG